VFRLILAESVLLGAIGSLIGLVVGVALAAAISAVGIPMPPPPNADLGYTAHIRIALADVAIAVAVGVLATTLAAILPAVRVSRTPVVDALRENV
jgi:putative ABC transport system permease protein